MSALPHRSNQDISASWHSRRPPSPMKGTATTGTTFRPTRRAAPRTCSKAPRSQPGSASRFISTTNVIRPSRTTRSPPASPSRCSTFTWPGSQASRRAFARLSMSPADRIACLYWPICSGGQVTTFKQLPRKPVESWKTRPVADYPGAGSLVSFRPSDFWPCSIVLRPRSPSADLGINDQSFATIWAPQVRRPHPYPLAFIDRPAASFARVKKRLSAAFEQALADGGPEAFVRRMFEPIATITPAEWAEAPARMKQEVEKSSVAKNPG
jgi:hypothetical protein